MNTASLENCKKLYELSGWEDTQKWHVQDKDKPPRPISSIQKLSDLNLEFWNKLAPAYDLGYLLRKLPRYDAEGWNLTLECMGEEAAIAYYRHNDDRHRHEVLGDTPEDAACLLAIELFEEGILNA